MDVQKPYLISFPTIGSSDLGYIAVSESKVLPFEVKRIYWICHTPETVTRGCHAHHEMQQIVIAVSGAIKIVLEDLAGDKMTICLDKPDIGLFIPKMYWRTINFSNDAVLLCLASTEYDELDYIRNFDDFKSLRSK